MYIVVAPVPTLSAERVSIEMDFKTASALLTLTGAISRGPNDRVDVEGVKHDDIRPHTTALFLALLGKGLKGL